MNKQSVINALTVDVEDYFQVSAFDKHVQKSEWSKMPLRVEANTRKLLDLFDEASVHGTFFVLGWVAERMPRLIREIDERGHEIACHGYSHALVFDQAPDTFLEETHRSKSILEEIVGKPVNGYRAASYSITKKSIWALDILARLGFLYDSSVFPVHHDRYGIPDAQREPHIVATPSGHTIAEFPISTWRFLRQNIPVAGGGYFRLLPYKLTTHGLRQINEKEKTPFVFYLHPWEIDPDQPRISASILSRLRHYTNLHRTLPRLRLLLQTFAFSTMYEILEDYSLIRATSEKAK